MRRRLILLLLALSTFSAIGQSTSIWQSGSVVLVNDQVLAGEIMVHVDFNTLVYRSASHVEVLPSYKISSFRFYDEAENINRQFMSIRDSLRGVDSFYELVVKGAYNIVRKQDHTYARDDQEDYTYYVYHEKSLMPIRKFKKKVFPDLLSSRPDLDQWIKTERLDLNQKKTAILIVQEYNREFTEMVASR